MLQILSEKVAECKKCEQLVDGRIQTVFGGGNPNAKIMMLGEAPGRTESETGKPFVGPAGQLLTNILTACGWKREDVYIANICNVARQTTEPLRQKKRPIAVLFSTCKSE